MITTSNNTFISGWHLHGAAQHDQQDGGGPDAAVQREAAQGQVRLLLLLLDHGQRQQELTLIGAGGGRITHPQSLHLIAKIRNRDYD